MATGVPSWWVKAHLRSVGFGLALVACCSAPACALTDSELRRAVGQRFEGDRSGTCVAAAVIEGGTTATAYVCADPASPRPYDEHTAFEIGSVTKTMTAALLAQSVLRGALALGDPLSRLLPPEARVPSFEGRPITLGDIVTHTSGLPSFPWRTVADPANPYAGLTERDLLGTLAHTTLTRAPGTRWEYSNFAMMLLSDALARRSGTDFETLMRDRLLAPLGMQDTYVAARPPRVRVAQGHLPSGQPAKPWDFRVDAAGAGGVRSTLPDMVRYLEGELGLRGGAVGPALALTQQLVVSVDGHAMAMAWTILSTPGGHRIIAHEGGTGGFSSLVAFDPVAQRGVVLLSDTALTSLGGLGSLGLSLLDPSIRPGSPRRAATPGGALLDALAGRYRLKDGMGIELRRSGQALFVQAEGQPAFEMGYDTAGDFYPLLFDAVLHPRRRADGSYALTWRQGGGVVEVERIGGAPPVTGP